MQRKLNWHSNLFTNEENLYEKKPHGKILSSPLLRIHYYQNKHIQVQESLYLIPTYSWTLTHTQLNFFYTDNLSFQCMVPSTWLTNYADPNTRLDHRLKNDVGCKVLQFITRWKSWSCLVIKPYYVQNTTASSRERRTRAN